MKRPEEFLKYESLLLPEAMEEFSSLTLSELCQLIPNRCLGHLAGSNSFIEFLPFQELAKSLFTSMYQMKLEEGYERHPLVY